VKPVKYLPSSLFALCRLDSDDGAADGRVLCHFGSVVRLGKLGSLLVDVDDGHADVGLGQIRQNCVSENKFFLFFFRFFYFFSWKDIESTVSRHSETKSYGLR
jgi:hypothetical protein